MLVFLDKSNGDNKLYYLELDLSVCTKSVNLRVNKWPILQKFMSC